MQFSEKNAQPDKFGLAHCSRVQNWGWVEKIHSLFLIRTTPWIATSGSTGEMNVSALRV